MTKPDPDLDEDAEMAIHDRNVAVICEAVAGLLPQFAGQGLTPVAAFEGAVKGATIGMIVHNGCTTIDVAEMLEEIATALRHPNRPDLRVVQ